MHTNIHTHSPNLLLFRNHAVGDNVTVPSPNNNIINNNNNQIAPPDTGIIGKLSGEDQAVSLTVLVPQPSLKFSTHCDAIEIERKPKAEAVNIVVEVGKGDINLDVRESELTNGRKCVGGGG